MACHPTPAPPRKRRLAELLAVLVVAAPAAAQIPLLQPGPEHEKLDFLIGRWRVETNRLQPVKLELTSEATFSWKYGGVWLQGYEPTEFESSGTVHNLTLMTFNRHSGVYEGVWWDNVSPTLSPFTGRWIDDQTLVLDSGDTEFAGRPHRAVVTYTKLSPSRVRKEFRWSWDDGDLELAAVSTLEKLD